MVDVMLQPGEDWAAWGARTGRYLPDQIPAWRQRIHDEASRVTASSGVESGPNEVEATIQMLYPAYAPGEALSGWPAYEGDGAPDPRRLLARAGLDPYTGRPVAAGGNSATPLVDQLDRALYGPSPQQRRAELDAACERELAELDERDRIKASTGLTDDEYRALFGNG